MVGQYKTKLRLISTQVKVEVEVGVELGNIEPILCKYRGPRYLGNKTGFRNRQVHIHTDLKWSSQHQSGLEMPRVAPDWTGHTLRGLQGPQVTPTGLPGGVQATQGPVTASQGHSGAVRTTSGEYEYVLF